MLLARRAPNVLNLAVDGHRGTEWQELAGLPEHQPCEVEKHWKKFVEVGPTHRSAI
jgi:hypothetical protein